MSIVERERETEIERWRIERGREALTKRGRFEIVLRESKRDQKHIQRERVLRELVEMNVRVGLMVRKGETTSPKSKTPPFYKSGFFNFWPEQTRESV